MTQAHGDQYLLFPEDRYISVASAIRARASFKSNLWLFDSPKNNKRAIIEGDVAFIHTVLLEGNTSVANYDINPPPVIAEIDGEVRQTTLDTIVYFRDGREEWVEYKRSEDTGPSRKGRAVPQLNAQAQAAARAGKTYNTRTEKDLLGKELLFDNWLHLCGSITRARRYSTYTEERTIKSMLDLHGEIPVSALFDSPNCDPGLMNAALAKYLQQGLIDVDLVNKLLTHGTVIRWRST
ncbi:hypothetical protein [Noviherbaspirillum denitrificans]|uniref:TnsA endonuclease N-terminal domain-containing protein n=1 Tax=Noviherbaspirillum denitrificans TaxID=1968433 RepID=A0A254T9U3_9BURK|nr:hypothetical protein [Noviherbaspirillum denitrificans]OWW18072.1 hypothetical protein AYR66_02320 [Noviherbaspirillum denitrificans]